MKRIIRAESFYLIVAVVFAGFFMFYKLGGTHLIEFDEGIYALVAKNILKSGDWFTLQWNLGHPWFDKGPLYLWLTAISIKVFGLTSLAVRFWSAAFGVVGCLSVFLIGKKLYNSRVGFMASVILGSTLGYLNYARLGMLDVPNATFNSLSLLLLIISLEKPGYTRLAALVLALGFLNRQLLSFLGLGAFFIFLLVERRRPPYRTRDILVPVTVFLAIIAPWHLVETVRYGWDFWQVYFFHQTVARFSQTIEGKFAPLLWYLTVAKTHFRIWFVVLLLSVPGLIYKVFKRDSGTRLLVIWAGTTFLVFTFAQSKLMWYIMPLYPPLALLVAKFIDSVFGKIKLGFLAPIIVISVAAVYNFLLWNRIMPRDFTYDQVSLIEYKNKIDPGADLLSVGYSYSVSSFYSQGKVIPIPKEQTKGFFEALGYRYAIISLGDLDALSNKNGFHVIYEVGDGVLISSAK